jgi:hypothetical protein
VLREHILDILRKVSPTLEEKALLDTAEGLKAIAEFVAADSTLGLGDYAGASDRHSSQTGGSLSTGSN